MAVIDLLAVLPFYLTFFTADLRFIRALRLFRLFRMAKLGRYSSSVRLFGRVFKNKKEELFVTAMVMLLMIIMSASFMYFAENEAQPDKFPDIPSTVWWSVMTLTTVGYGDVFPDHGAGQSFGDGDCHTRNRDVRPARGHLRRRVCRRDSETEGREDDLPALRRGDRVIARVDYEIGWNKIWRT
jgi:hypothetical protein